MNTMDREKNLDGKAAILKTIGHPVRLQIIAGLAHNCSCVKDIWECLNMPQAVVSQHLKVMKENGVLDAQRDGTRMRYYLKNQMIAELVKALQL